MHSSLPGDGETTPSLVAFLLLRTIRTTKRRSKSTTTIRATPPDDPAHTHISPICCNVPLMVGMETRVDVGTSVSTVTAVTTVLVSENGGEYSSSRAEEDPLRPCGEAAADGVIDADTDTPGVK